MRDSKHARMMLALAKKDFGAIGRMTGEKDFETEIFGFHAQQAVEKALKAWLSFIGVEYPKTHDLDQLFTLLAGNGVGVPGNFLELAELSDFAVQYRYETYETPVEEVNRRGIVSLIGELINHIGKML